MLCWYRCNINTLVTVSAHDDIAKQQEKFNVLWKYSTNEEKREFLENWKPDKINIPIDSNSGFKM